MPKQSSNFVKVFLADKQKVLSEMSDHAAKLKRTRPDVKVGYFGSYAIGSYGPVSDVGLSIILKQSSKHFLDRILDFLLDNLSICCDVFPCTSEEIRKMK